MIVKNPDLGFTFDLGSIFNDIGMIILIISLTVNGYLFIRNHLVYKEREKVRKLIFETENGNYKRTQFEVIELMDKSLMKYSYFEMWLKVWKPTKSFFKDFYQKLESGEIPNGRLSDGRVINETNYR